MSVFGNALHLVVLLEIKKKKDFVSSSKHSQFSVEIGIYSFVASYKVLIFVNLMFKVLGVHLRKRSNLFSNLGVFE